MLRPLAISMLVPAWLVWSSPAVVDAQATDSLPIPARVRVIAPPFLSGPTIATVTARGPAFLVLDIPARGSLSIPLGSIQRLDISRGRKTRTGTGALVGLLVGTAATAVFLAGFCSDPDTLCQTDEVGLAFVLIAGPPTLVGALIGAAVRSEDWDRISLQRFGLMTRQSAELRLGVRLRL